MIVVGIIMVVVGGILYLFGTSVNNDIDAQMESIFETGIADPGDTMVSVGVVLIVLGFVFLVIGLIRRSSARSVASVNRAGAVRHTVAQPVGEEMGGTCKNCGHLYRKGAKFCYRCGAKIEEVPPAGRPMFCANCGQPVKEEQRFCVQCGESVGTAEEG